MRNAKAMVSLVLFLSPLSANAMSMKATAASSPPSEAHGALPPATRSPRTAQLLSLGGMLVPIATGFAIGVDGPNQVAAGWLIATGALAGPGTGLVYGRCYRHAIVGTGLRVLGASLAIAGVGLEMEVGGGGPAIWGGLGLYGASTAYDLLAVSRCTGRHNPKPSANLNPSISIACVEGAPALTVTLGF